MKQLLTILFCLVFSLSIYAQSERKDFGKRIISATTDTGKAFAYRSALNYFSDHDPDSFKFYTAQSLSYFRNKNSILGEGLILAQLGMIDKKQGRINIAMQRLQLALGLFRRENYAKGIADVLGNIGSLEAGKGNIDVAARYIIASLRLEDSIGNKDGVLVAYMNLGSLYMQQNDTIAARIYLDKAHEISKSLPISDHIIGLYNLRGVLFAIEGQKEKALTTFQHNLELSDNPSFISSHVECLSYLAQYYLDEQQPQKAIYYLEEGMKLATTFNLPEMKSNMLLTKAAITQSSDAAATLRSLDEALQIARDMDNKAFMVYVYEAQAAYYKELGRFKEALEANETKQKINDSLFSINKSIELSSIAATYELDKSNMKVQDLVQESKRNANQRNIFILVSVVILILLFILYSYYRRTLALNRQLKEHQEELKELNVMKDKLFSIIGHDLRGPISGIPAVLDIYEDPRTNEEEKQFLLDSLREHAQASAEMLDKLLFWGQSLVKGLRLQESSVDVKETIRQNVALKKIALDEKGIKVVDNIPQGLKVVVDMTHLDFIIRNLLSNAIKYAHLGGTITFAADTTTRPGYTTLSVADNGTGIPESVLPRIFNPLYSVPGTNNEKGNGIGLMLCKEFTVLNGGNIWVESEFGKGATFSLALRSATK